MYDSIQPIHIETIHEKLILIMYKLRDFLLVKCVKVITYWNTFNNNNNKNQNQTLSTSQTSCKDIVTDNTEKR